MNLIPPQKGYIARFNLFGIPTFIHWTFPLGGLAIALLLGHMAVSTTIAAVASYVFLVICHELGHAFFALRSSCKVHGIVVALGGGFCIAETSPSPRDAFLFSSGGLLFQAVLFLITIVLLAIFGRPTSPVLNVFALVFTLFNAILFLSNVIPYKSNDGSMILKAIRRWGSDA